MQGARILLAAAATVLTMASAAGASVWQQPVPLVDLAFHFGGHQIAVNDDGEVVSLVMQSETSRLVWLGADGTLHAPQTRAGTLGAADDGTLFLVSGDGTKVSVATKPPGLPFGPDVPVADGPGGSGPIDVSRAGDVVFVLGDDLGILRRGAATAERIEIPFVQYSLITDIELTEGGEILVGRVHSAVYEVVIVPAGGGEPRVERVGDRGCDFELAAGPAGRAVAAWAPRVNENSCTGTERNVASLRPAGGSFGPPAAVPGQPWQREPHIAVDSAGRAIIASDSSYPNGVTPYVTVLTAGPADTTWTTSTAALGYSDGIASSPAGVWVAYGSSFGGPRTARVGDTGKLEDVQDVIADCALGSMAFAVAPSGRAAMLAWRYAPQQFAIFRQVAGDASASQCGRDLEPQPPTPTPPAPPPPSPPTPITKPPAPTVTASAARRTSRRRVTVRFTRSDAGRLSANGTLRVAGRKALKAKVSGFATITLTFRVPARTWRTLARKGARLTLRAASPEGGRWDFRRTLKR